MSTSVAPRASPAFRLCTRLAQSSLTPKRWPAAESTRLSAQRAAFSQAHSRLAWTAPTRTAFKPAVTSTTTAPATPASSTTTTPSAPPSPPPTTVRATTAAKKAEQERSLTDGLSDHPDALTAPAEPGEQQQIDWARSYHGLGNHSFSPEAQQTLLAPVDPEDVEVKPDGIIYLPEIKYRRILNRAFGPGGWGLAPRGESIVTARLVTREYGLVAHGRLVSIARGEQQFFEPDGIPTATEGCKSNALMRCCKDIGIASELWDPRFIRKFLAANTREAWVEHVVNKKKRKITIRKDDAVRYPFQETKMGGASGKV